MSEQSTGGKPEAGPSVTDPTGAPMMIAKFRAELGPLAVVRRQRLFDRLSAGVRLPVTLITAPAGAGKTTLVGSWASAGLCPGALTWISLDNGDEQPGVFWSYVLEGLSRSGVPVSAVGAPLLAAAVDQSFLVRLSAVLYGRQEPVVIVLDDADVLTRGPVLTQIDFLLRHSGPALRVVLVTRMHPGPALRRHRLAGSLTEIGLDELAFTADEARLLLRARGVTPSDGALAGLMSRTRGWATGLVLAATSARLRPDGAPAVSSLAGDPGELADYFSAEVLSVQPPGIRRFMLRTSIVTHLQPALADQLTGRRDADRILRTLARTNSFLEACSQHDDCYRYHPLFAELLRAEFGRETPAAVVPLHRKAAAWLLATGSLTEGVRHAAAAADWATAAAFLVDNLAIVRLLVGPDAARLATFLAPMPATAGDPNTAAVLAALAIGRSEVESCSESLLRVQKWTADGVERSRTLAATVAIIELVLARTRTDLDGAFSAAATAEAVLDDLAADDVPVPPATRAFVLFSTGSALFSAGLPERAATSLTDGLRAAQGPGCDHLRAACLGLLALVEAVRGRLPQAAELGRAANTLADECGLEPRHRPAADVALAWVHAEACDISSAQVHVKRAAAAVALSRDPVTAGLDALVRSSLRRTAGDLDGALSVIHRARGRRSRGPLPGWLDDRLHAAAAAVQVRAGRPAIAISSIEGGTGSGGVEARPRLRSFIDHDGATTQSWLRAAADGATDRKRAAPAPRRGPGLAPAPVVVEPLTEKEHEVLQHLAALLSTEEIALTMFVSVNTVKTHVRGILRKLAASRRNEAIRRARDLGLI